ncbi:unnamed protein product, partial [Cylicostephanus goldi]
DLINLWEQVYHQILPLLQSVLYPIQRRRPEFDIRRTILTIFRDRVLSKVLRDVHERIPVLEPMLFTILLETENTSEESKNFAILADRVMGKGDKPAQPETRIRSRTLPNKPVKRVSWDDLRKSATFST